MRKFYLTCGLVLIIQAGFSQTQIDNAGFENWENAGTTVDEPTEWSSIKTSDDATLNGFAPVVWGQSSDAHSGDYSLELINVSTFGVVANGTVTNGRVHADFCHGFVPLPLILILPHLPSRLLSTGQVTRLGYHFSGICRNLPYPENSGKFRQNERRRGFVPKKG